MLSAAAGAANATDENPGQVSWKQLELEGPPIGQGQFATVRRCLYTPKQGDEPLLVAVKQVKSKLGFRHDLQLRRTKQYDRLFCAEAELQLSLRHRFIVRCYGCGWAPGTASQHFPPDNQMFFLEEFMAGGSLQQVVIQAMLREGERTWYSDKLALRWALQLAMALEYLHTCTPKIIHRDLKLENVMLTHPKLSRFPAAKLGDFGLARRLQSSDRSVKLRDVQGCQPGKVLASESQVHLAAAAALPGAEPYLPEEMTAPAGSLGYMAPEVFLQQPYNEKADVFSYSVLVWNLFHREIPTAAILLNGDFSDLEAYAAKVAHGFRQPLSPNVPREVRSLIERCWQADPSLRPSMSAVVQELAALQPPLPPDDGFTHCATGASGHDSGGSCCSIM